MEEDIYSLQHFGFTATQITHERKHLLVFLLKSGLSSLIAKATQRPHTAHMLKQKQDKIVKSMLESLESEFEELATMDLKYFQIPDNVLLAQDFDHINNYTEEQRKEIDGEIEKYEKQFLENCVMVKSLEQEMEHFEVIKPYLEQQMGAREKLEMALNLLYMNKLTHVENLVEATKKVVDTLQKRELAD